MDLGKGAITHTHTNKTLASISILFGRKICYFAPANGENSRYIKSQMDGSNRVSFVHQHHILESCCV